MNQPFNLDCFESDIDVIQSYLHAGGKKPDPPVLPSTRSLNLVPTEHGKVEEETFEKVFPTELDEPDAEKTNVELDRMVGEILKSQMDALGVSSSIDPDMNKLDMDYGLLAAETTTLPCGRPPLAPVSQKSFRFMQSAAIPIIKPQQKGHAVTAVESFSGGFFSSVDSRAENSAYLVDEVESVDSHTDNNRSDTEHYFRPPSEQSSRSSSEQFSRPTTPSQSIPFSENFIAKCEHINRNSATTHNEEKQTKVLRFQKSRSKSSLVKRALDKEMKECTFKPKINKNYKCSRKMEGGFLSRQST